jgi:hypothetical protein
MRNILLQFVSGVCVWNVIRYFLFENQPFNGILKVIRLKSMFEIFFARKKW